MRIPKKVTLEFLEKVKRAYENNFKKLITAREGSSNKKNYLRAEKELNKIEIEIHKKLGIFRYDPCKLVEGKNCERCTGYIKHLLGMEHWVAVRPNTRGSEKCWMKSFLENKEEPRKNIIWKHLPGIWRNIQKSRTS